MATTINADNGVVSGSAGLKSTPDSSGILALQTNGTTAVTVDAAQDVTLADALTVPGVLTAGTISSGAITSSGVVTGSTGALYPLVRSTAVASTSGTSIDFTGIPSTAKRITLMFSGVSLSGTSNILVQLGSGSAQTTGYNSTSINVNNANATSGGSSTAGFIVFCFTASDVVSGLMTIANISANNWVSNHTVKRSTITALFGGGDVALSGVLDRVRITTVNGTDTFDAGSVNILWE